MYRSPICLFISSGWAVLPFLLSSPFQLGAAFVPCAVIPLKNVWCIFPTDFVGFYDERESLNHQDCESQLSFQDLRPWARQARQRDKYQCRFCPYTALQKSCITIHERIHTKERPYSCLICHKTFTRKSQLDCHKRVHTGEKPFRCQICHRQFSERRPLVRHMRIHTGERPYRCRFCQQAFAQSTHLLDHEKIHTGERPFKCATCGSTYRLKYCLKLHERTHTGEQSYRCETCGKAFSQNRYLTEHRRRCHMWWILVTCGFLDSGVNWIWENKWK